jgi:ketosteroid isomerase-like protein
MKPILLFALPWLSILASAPEAPTSPATLIECEHAFARDAASLGSRAAFLKWLSPTAVVFQPGPVNGRKAYAAARPRPAVLAWQPAFAGISESGDLGWTTGPWSWRPAPDQMDVAWGEYLTVWRRQPDGAYLAALDIGIDHARPGEPAGEPVHLQPAGAARGGRGPLDKRRALWKADAEYGQLAKQGGVAVALDHFGAEAMLLLRDGLPRVVGRAAACDTIRSREQSATLMSLAQFLSDKGDLGYTYGSFVGGDAAAPDSGWYVHIWQRGTAKPWELAVELVHPLPKPEKK